MGLEPGMHGQGFWNQECLWVSDDQSSQRLGRGVQFGLSMCVCVGGKGVVMPESKGIQTGQVQVSPSSRGVSHTQLLQAR